MLTELKKKKDVAVDDETLLAHSEGVQNLTSIQEYHHSYKSAGWIKNENRENLCRQLCRLSFRDAQCKLLKKKIKKQTFWHQKFCFAGCGMKTSQRCVVCKEFVHLDPLCWNAFHENLAHGWKPIHKNCNNNGQSQRDRGNSISSKNPQNMTTV
eukprot:3713568-Ditylum_brightwellii.AAC.1